VLGGGPADDVNMPMARRQAGAAGVLRLRPG
jgi:hypothetical protein